jgi:hypothetical protein
LAAFDRQGVEKVFSLLWPFYQQKDPSLYASIV